MLNKKFPFILFHADWISLSFISPKILKLIELIDFNNREFSVSLIWNGTNSVLYLFKKYLNKINLRATFGGKMINISGVHSKLDALIYFKQMYLKKFNTKKV